MAGAQSDQTSPPKYPSPWGSGDGEWAEAYKKAIEVVKQLTLEEKVNLTTGLHSPYSFQLSDMSTHANRHRVATRTMRRANWRCPSSGHPRPVSSRLSCGREIHRVSLLLSSVTLQTQADHNFVKPCFCVPCWHQRRSNLEQASSLRAWQGDGSRKPRQGHHCATWTCRRRYRKGELAYSTPGYITLLTLA